MRENSGKSAIQGVLGLVLALLLPFAARAASGGEIRNYIISINHLYESLDYELALSRIQLARQQPRGTDDEVTLSLYEGIILYEMRKQGPAASVFRSALLLRPDAKLPVQVAPKVEALFESMRKRVKQEVVPLIPQSATEKTSSKAEQKQEPVPASPATGPSQEKREDTRIAQSPKKEGPSSVEPSASTTQVVQAEVKVAPTPPTPSAQKVEPKKVEPVAVQPLKTQGCGPMPASVSSRNQKDQQLWRLASMQRALCLSGKFQGVVAERWTGLKIRMENATTSHERTLITIAIDQFAREFVYKDPAREQKQREAERLAANQHEAERLAADQQKREDTRIAQSPKKEGPSSVEPSASATQVVKAEVKVAPTSPTPSAQKVEPKKEVAPLIPQSATEKTSSKAEQKQEPVPASPATGPSQEKREDTRIAQSPKKEGPSSVEPKASATQVAKTDTKLPPIPPAPSTLKAEQKKEAPVAVQPQKSPDCEPMPASAASRNQKDQQLWRLAHMQRALCLSGKFQGRIAERWSGLKTRMEAATTSHERALITKDIDQFASEFIYEDTRREQERLKAERLEAERLEAERLEAERLAAKRLEAERLAAERLAAKRLEVERLESEEREPEQREVERALIKKQLSEAANLDTSKCQPIVSADCELLMQRLRYLQQAFLRTNPPSKLPPIRQLVTIGQEIRAARSKEDLQEAAHALNLWQQRQLPQ